MHERHHVYVCAGWLMIRVHLENLYHGDLEQMFNYCWPRHSPAWEAVGIGNISTHYGVHPILVPTHRLVPWCTQHSLTGHTPFICRRGRGQ